MIGNCTQSGCHVSSGDDHLFPLVTYEDIAKQVQPGDAANSRLYTVVRGLSGHLMPPPPQPMLTDEQIKFIYVWIEEGAQNN